VQLTAPGWSGLATQERPAGQWRPHTPQLLVVVSDTHAPEQQDPPEHPVPLARAVWTQVPVAEQLSVVQGFPSSHRATVHTRLEERGALVALEEGGLSKEDGNAAEEAEADDDTVAEEANSDDDTSGTDVATCWLLESSAEESGALLLLLLLEVSVAAASAPPATHTPSRHTSVEAHCEPVLHVATQSAPRRTKPSGQPLVLAQPCAAPSPSTHATLTQNRPDRAMEAG
jgi:hypothetical protein